MEDYSLIYKESPFSVIGLAAVAVVLLYEAFKIDVVFISILVFCCGLVLVSVIGACLIGKFNKLYFNRDGMIIKQRNQWKPWKMETVRISWSDVESCYVSWDGPRGNTRTLHVVQHGCDDTALYIEWFCSAERFAELINEYSGRQLFDDAKTELATKQYKKSWVWTVVYTVAVLAFFCWIGWMGGD